MIPSEEILPIHELPVAKVAQIWQMVGSKSQRAKVYLSWHDMSPWTCNHQLTHNGTIFEYIHILVKGFNLYLPNDTYPKNEFQKKNLTKKTFFTFYSI